MPNVSKMFPGKFLKAADLDGKSIKVTIAGLTEDEVGDSKGKKWILNFKDKDRGLVLNVTNANMIAAHYGDESDNWSGKEVILYVEKVSYQGKIVDAIRVRVESSPFPPAAEEDIPF